MPRAAPDHSIRHTAQRRLADTRRGRPLRPGTGPAPGYLRSGLRLRGSSARLSRQAAPARALRTGEQQGPKQPTWRVFDTVHLQQARPLNAIQSRYIERSSLSTQDRSTRGDRLMAKEGATLKSSSEAALASYEELGTHFDQNDPREQYT